MAVVGLIASTAAWFAVSLREDRLAALEMASLANGQALTLQVGIGAYLRKVAALRALFESADDKVSRAQFEQFTKQLMSDQTAMLGMSWHPRVARDQRVAQERAAVLEGIPGYQIKDVAPDGTMVPAPEKNEYFPVFYTATKAPLRGVRPRPQ